MHTEDAYNTVQETIDFLESTPDYEELNSEGRLVKIKNQELISAYKKFQNVLEEKMRNGE